MTVETAMKLSGILFWLIIITNIGSNQFGYKTFGDVDSQVTLQSISEDPREFKIGFSLIVFEHFCIICLAVTLFIAFGNLSAILGIIWLMCRGTEGFIQILNKRNYWRLIKIARQYSNTNVAERGSWIEQGSNILASKHSNFVFAQILFALGTLAYSTLFVTSGGAPAVIGWFGVAAGILYGCGNLLIIVNSDIKAIWNFGGLLVLIFEIMLGSWLLFV